MTRWTVGWRRAVILVAAVAGMAATWSLGRWQLSRAAQKEALQAVTAERQHLPALDGVTLHAPIRTGQVVLTDVCGTGVDVVATRDL